MSWESDYARRIAMFYGPVRCRMSRSERIAWVRAEIARLETLMGERDAAHVADCLECRNGALCIDRLILTPETQARLNKLTFLRVLIDSEERDEQYARHAQAHGVVYENHIDGFCRYWQNLRHRKFVIAGWKCERCGTQGPLEAHHRHYDRLGFETIADLQALCWRCHEIADRERAANTRFNNAMDTYMQKKYGDYYCWPDDAEEEFEEWLERQEEEY